jgi:hypothetical protein
MRLILLICFVMLFVRIAIEVLKLSGEFSGSTLALLR